MFFCFKQKTAYEMRISDWSSDVCSSDLWISNIDAQQSRDIWRANLLGGSRAHDLIKRLRTYPTLRQFAEQRQWDFGEGYIAGQKGISRPANHLIGKPLLPTNPLSPAGLHQTHLSALPTTDRRRVGKEGFSAFK